MENKMTTLFRSKVLVVFAHPDPHESVANKCMIKSACQLDNVTVHDLYASYPDFIIDVHYERELLIEHDVIVFQHPLQMYSCPSLLKEWIDVVLGKGFAHGGGNALSGKLCRFVITTGGVSEAFSQNGYNKYSMDELLQPFELTVLLCKMRWVEPLVLHWARRVTDEDRNRHAECYVNWLCKPVPEVV
ncbi:glutathione-regulated potassium-efflux system ancillary protein KefG [Candidatus Enterovibrio escicola]|uniref:Glutathione-regulated potassium-efflux system ancillary protein KefG n=1 Tax=Candidatus Enterovibrio escicola TaxID=1927127 RepID=A0A2A5T4N2_9GAMM|nr:glutathione-regulated potassium-efflux system ancillary protein KefG [Candidatus Enterovibrio escacola]PCS23078.1 Glutathione-regulated potassium-efflux system ancillary protein KefG [Candidatus Enterovibrio escacola]